MTTLENAPSQPETAVPKHRLRHFGSFLVDAFDRFSNAAGPEPFTPQSGVSFPANHPDVVAQASQVLLQHAANEGLQDS